MKVTVKKGDKTFVVTSQTQLDAFKSDGYTEVKEVKEEPKKETPKRKREE
jgi:hypothetical protein